MTSSQAHCLPFSGGGGQTQLFNVECQSGRTIALLSDFAVIQLRLCHIQSEGYSCTVNDSSTVTVIPPEDIRSVANVSAAMYDARWFWA